MNWITVKQFRYLGHDAEWKHASCKFVQIGPFEYRSVTDGYPITLKEVLLPTDPEEVWV